MFKVGSFEDELRSSMAKNLVANDLEKGHNFSKLAKAADLLNNAASIFEKAGMVTEASEITDILVGLTSKLSK